MDVRYAALTPRRATERAVLAALLAAAHAALFTCSWQGRPAPAPDRKPQAAASGYLTLLPLPLASKPLPAKRPDRQPSPAAPRARVAPPVAAQIAATGPATNSAADSAAASSANRSETIASAPTGAATPAPAATADDPLDLSAPASNAIHFDQIKRGIGKIDRELRGAAPAVPGAPPDSMQARLERGIGAAGRPETIGFVLNRYVSPDGVTVYQRVRGNNSSCYIVPPASGISAIQSGRDERRRIKCPPADAGWTKVQRP